MLAELLGLGERRHSLDNPNVSLHSEEAYDTFTGGRRTDAGVRFGPLDGFGYAPVYAAVSMISGDVATMPLDLFRRLDPKGREKHRKHWAFRLVRWQANDEQSAVRFWRQMLTNLCYWSHAEAFIDRTGRGHALGLYPMLPDRTFPHRRDGRLYYVTETSHRDGTPWLRPVPAEDVLTLRGLFWDDMEPCELVDLARQAWATGLARQKFESKFFASGGRTGGVLELPLAMPKTGMDKVEEGFRKTYESADSWFKTVILRDGAKFHGANRSPQEGQMVEASERAVRDVARFFNMLPSRLGVQGSVSYNSRSEDNLQYLQTTLGPILTDIVQECRIKLLTPEERDSDEFYFEHNPDSLLRMTPKDRAQVNAIAIRGGWRSPDEVREDENMNPRPDGKGGQFVDVANAKSPGGADKGANDRPRGPAGGEDEIVKTDEDRSGVSPWFPDVDPDRRHAIRRVIFRLGDHARSKAKKPRGFGEWLAGDLVSHREEAKRLIGDDAIVADVLAKLRDVESRATVTELEAAVEAAVSDFERYC